MSHSVTLDTLISGCISNYKSATKIFLFISDDDLRYPLGIIMSFKSLGLSESIVKAISEKGYKIPTPVQSQAIPTILKGSDVMACAQTGTGKTAGFTLPLLEMLSKKENTHPKVPRALILTPTRELAAQIQECIDDYSKYLPLRSTIVFGGVSINQQKIKLSRGVDIIVATPGRLLDLFKQRAVQLSDIQHLILDEADRMLDMGFIHDIKKILALLPKKRQNLLFSATFSKEVRSFAKGLIHNAIEINVSSQKITAEKIQHKIHPVDKSKKSELLYHLIQKHGWYQALVFCRTKHGANKLEKFLWKNNIEALAIHGGRSQAQRTKALETFKNGKIQILVATDIVARGIDVEKLEQVIIFDLPNIPEDYVHRIGRTGRAGATGEAISLVSADEIKQLKDIEKVLKCTIKREIVEGFDPIHSLPTSVPVNAAKRVPSYSKKSSNQTFSKETGQKSRSKKTSQGKSERFPSAGKSATASQHKKSFKPRRTVIN